MSWPYYYPTYYCGIQSSSLIMCLCFSIVFPCLHHTFWVVKHKCYVNGLCSKPFIICSWQALGARFLWVLVTGSGRVLSRARLGWRGLFRGPVWRRDGHLLWLFHRLLMERIWQKRSPYKKEKTKVRLEVCKQQDGQLHFKKNAIDTVSITGKHE